MKELSVEELLLNISYKEEDLKNAHNNFNELYWRYSKFLLGAIKSHLRSKGIYNEDMADTILSNVFCEIFESPLGFSFDPQKHSSEDKAFKAWVSRIARNEFMDLLRESIEYNNRMNIDDELVERYAELPLKKEELSDNMKAIERALSVLTEKERHILLSCFDYYEIGKKTPSKVLDYLETLWGTTKPNIRQIKKRSLDKVKNELEKNSKLNLVK